MAIERKGAPKGSEKERKRLRNKGKSENAALGRGCMMAHSGMASSLTILRSRRKAQGNFRNEKERSAGLVRAPRGKKVVGKAQFITQLSRNNTPKEKRGKEMDYGSLGIGSETRTIPWGSPALWLDSRSKRPNSYERRDTEN